MDFNLSDVQLASRSKARELVKSLAADASADEVIRAAMTEERQAPVLATAGHEPAPDAKIEQPPDSAVP